jgi:hypothetical protein
MPFRRPCENRFREKSPVSRIFPSERTDAAWPRMKNGAGQARHFNFGQYFRLTVEAWFRNKRVS